MPRMDLYLTDRRESLLRDGAARVGLSRSRYIGRLLDMDEENPYLDTDEFKARGESQERRG